MDFQPPSVDTSMELHPSQLTSPESRSSMTRSVPRPLGTKTSQPHRGPIFAITGEATSIRFLSSRSAGSTTGSLSGPSPATTNVQPVEPSSDTFVSDMLQWAEKQQSITSGRQSFYRGSHDANYPSMGLHPSQFTGPEFGQTSQSWIGPTVPILAAAGEATSTHFLSLCGSGYTTEQSTESISSSQSHDHQRVQPVDPSSGIQWVEKQQSFDSGRQNSYRSHDANHSSMKLHPSQSSSREVRQTSQPVPDITIGPTASMPLSGSGTTGDITTESPSSPSLMITTVQPVEPSSHTSTLQVIELEDVEVTCLLCGGAFLGYQASRHLREIHPALVRKNDRSLCPLCTTTTPAKEVTNFCRHFQKHHKVLRFKCSKCSYTALERWNVERHVQKMRGKLMCVKD